MNASWSRAWLGLVALGSVALFNSVALAQSDVWAAAASANDWMERSDYRTADSIIVNLEARAPEHPATLFTRGKFLFHRGLYSEAEDLLDRAIALTEAAPALVSLRDLVVQTGAVVADFETYTTRDGLFEIRYDAARDGLLIPWAEETLEAAYYEIGYDIGYWPEPPIRVEIYPHARTLARTSSLSEEAIEASGTIALCKYNKLMITSPRATLRGYGWRTTLAHEYVHYAIAHLTHAELPIWMHEALAKYLESRWTGSRGFELSPSRAALLGERLAADDMISFAQMHPSMAYLPTPEDAGLVFKTRGLTAP